MPTALEINERKPPLTSLQTRIVRNVFSNWGAYVLAMAVNFFLSPYVVQHLGNTGYGVWTLILSLTGYLGLLDLGVRGAVTRYVAKFHTESEHGRASNVASSAMFLFSIAGLIAILFSVAAAASVISRMGIPEQYVPAARTVLLVTGLNIAISLVSGVFGGILVGLQRFDLTNGIEVSINLLRAATIVFALHKGAGIVTLALIQLGFTLARLGANAGLARRLYPELEMQLNKIDLAGVRLIFSFSAFSFMLHVSGSLIYATDNVVIGTFLPVSALTFYVIGGNLAEYTRMLVAGISQALMPLASSIQAGKDEDQLRRVVLFTSRAGTMVVLPIAVTFMLRGSTFIRLWMGEQYADLSGKVLVVLALTLFFWAANSVTAGILIGLNKHKPLVPALLAEGLCNLGLSIYLVQRIGILGVAWGTAAPALIATLLFWPWYIQKSLEISPTSYAKSAWLRPMAAIVPFALGSYLIERLWPAHHLMLFFLQVLLLLPLAAAGYWALCLDTEHREGISRKFTQSFVRVFAKG